jgi:hypothetical protein
VLQGHPELRVHQAVLPPAPALQELRVPPEDRAPEREPVPAPPPRAPLPEQA